MKEKNCKEIILNKMYIGDFLANEYENIGHEIINLYKADNGKHYIYILPSGSISAKHNNCIQNILLARKTGKSTWEILAKAEGLTQLTTLKNTTRKDCENIHSEQIKYIDENNISYGGVKLYDIFKNNQGFEKSLLYTFEARKVVKPKKPLYITDKKEIITCFAGYEENSITLLKDKKLPKESLKMYINATDNPNDFKALTKIIENNSLWNEKTVPKFVLQKNPEEYEFLRIIGKEYDELAFSNMFKHFFLADKNNFCSFVKQVMGIKNFGLDYKVEREKGNIDLLIYDENNVIVVENKIKSYINGIDKRACNLYSDENYSQLVKYDRYLEKNYKDKNKFLFIFAPDYNTMITDFDFGMKFFVMDSGRKWCVIKYSKIYDFYSKNPIKVPYFNEFLYGLEKHAHDTDNYYEKDMHKKFNGVIESLK